MLIKWGNISENREILLGFSINFALLIFPNLDLTVQLPWYILSGPIG